MSLSLSYRLFVPFWSERLAARSKQRIIKKYQEDDYFRSNIKKLIALAYLPLDDIIKGFDLVAAEFDDDADDFLNYFEKTWIGEPKRRGKIFLSIQISILNISLYRSRTKKPLFDHKL